jgi:hypothetical protein
MRKPFIFAISTVILLTSCGTPSTAISQEAISVEYTFTSIPWLGDIYNCSGGTVINAEQRAADFQDPLSYNLTIRIGEPEPITSSAYQIGSEEIIVNVNPQNKVKLLNAQQVRGLFTGQITNWQAVGGSNTNVQVWVYSSGEDIQQIFESVALDGSPITTNARLATSPDEMAQAISSDVNAVGILTRHWMGSNVTEALSVSTEPVLAITNSEPQPAVKSLIACLQNKAP